jgi:putative peptidoglycan lipid II flippase
VDDSTGAFVRNTAVMSLGTALSRITGFLRLAAMAYALGITERRLADAYNIANITPNILYELALGGILTSVVVPVVVEWLQEHGRDAAWDVVRRLLTFAVLALSAVAVLAIVLAPWRSTRPGWIPGPNATACGSSARSSCGGSCRRSSSTGSARSPAGS